MEGIMAIMEKKNNQEELNIQNLDDEEDLSAQDMAPDFPGDGQRKSESKLIWILVAAIFLVLGVGFFLSFLIGRSQERQAQSQYEDLSDMMNSTATPKPAEENKDNSPLDDIAEPIATPEPEQPVVEEKDPLEVLEELGIPYPEDKVVDFEYLQTNVNEHIYAWIYIPGTNIDYPVLRHPSNDGFYLNHNLDGSKGYPGCIYTENFNSTDWTDPMTVLYGHDMRSTGTMFHQLHYFEKADFFDENQYVYIYTPEKLLVYHIFAAFVHSDEHLLLSHNFHDEEQFTSFMDGILNMRTMGSHIRQDEAIQSDSKIITLSTCIKNKPNNRYFVQGVLLNE